MKPPWTRRWPGQVVLTFATVCFVAVGWIYFFDRNGDGVDDGGLDLCAHATARSLVPPRVCAFLIAESAPPVPGRPDAFLPSTRSPPARLLAS